MKNNDQQSSKERILASAVKIFARKGYASTGMRELAEDAGVNLAMINYFFGTKKELLKVILETFFRGYIEIVERELTGTGTLENKLESFIHQAIDYIATHRDHMIVTLTELPHDDPDITEYKAQWARRAMLVIKDEVCVPIKAEQGVEVSPAAIGPLIIGMMSSRFLFEPVMEQLKPPGYGDQFLKNYPDIITTIFLKGISGLKDNDGAVSNG